MRCMLGNSIDKHSKDKQIEPENYGIMHLMTCYCQLFHCTAFSTVFCGSDVLAESILESD